MKSTRAFDQSDPSFLQPEWTEKETTLLIELWRELEANPTAYLHSRTAGGFNSYIAEKLSQRTNKPRTSHSISCKRSKMYKVVHFVNRFNEMQQVVGGRMWYDLPKAERDTGKMPVSVRKTSLNLTRESYNTLLKLKSVRKWAKVRKAIVEKPKVQTRRKVQHPSKCNSCWSSADVGALVQSWSQVMKKSNISVGAFMTQSYDQSATLYTPWSHSTLSAWRKMKRIATSYLFIQAFNERHAPVTWFQLSDRAQNSRMDWDALPAEFEDIDQAIFEQLHTFERAALTMNPKRDKVSSISVEKETRPTKTRVFPAASSLLRNVSSPDASTDDENLPELGRNPPRPKLRTRSPHLVVSSSNQTQQGEAQTHNALNTYNTLCESMEQLQRKQFKKSIHSLRADIERDLRLSTDMVRAIFFEQLGEPGQNGDATFVAKLLDEQERLIHDHFTKLQREHFGDKVIL